MRIGLALGSGAARGLAHVGVLEGLVDAGLAPCAVAGTSIGALVGGLFTRSLDPAAVRRDVLRAVGSPVFRRICGDYAEGVRQARGDASPRHRVRDLRRALLRSVAVMRRSMVPAAKYAALIDAFLGDDLPLEATKIPCLMVATGLRTRRERFLISGSMRHAVSASCAIPGVFPPVPHGRDELVDGAAVWPIPVTPARALGADVVIAVDVGCDDLMCAHGPSGIDAMLQSAAITRARLARLELDRADLVIVPAVRHLDWFDFHRAEEAMERGLEAVRQARPQLIALKGKAGAYGQQTALHEDRSRVRPR
jgi:NTE family protein